MNPEDPKSISIAPIIAVISNRDAIAALLYASSLATAGNLAGAVQVVEGLLSGKPGEVPAPRG